MGRQQDDRNSSSGAAVAEPRLVSSANSGSSQTSDCPPPLDAETHQLLVAALLSDEEDEIASFTDDDVSHGSGASQNDTQDQHKHQVSVADGPGNPNATDAHELDTRLSQTNQSKRSSTNASPQQLPEKQFESPDIRISRPAISSSQASSVKAAAAAAAAAYSTKRSVHSRDTSPFVASPYDLSSEPTSPVDDCSILTPMALGGLRNGKVHAEAPTTSVPETELMSEASGGTITATEKPVTEDGSLSKHSNMYIAHGENSTVDTTEAVRGSFLMVKESSNPGKVGLQKTDSSIKADTNKENSGSEDAGWPLVARLEQKLSPARDLKKGTIVEKVDNPMESPQAHGGSRAKGGKGMEVRHQRKSLNETKSKVAVKTSTKEDITLGEANVKVSRSPDQKNGKREMKAEEEAKVKVALAQAKAAAAEAKVQHLETEVEKLKGELRDVAAIEAGLYSVTAEHGSSSSKVHSPARRLARMYIYACKHGSHARRASCARNTVAGLVLIARACGHDVPRLTFWWSNTVVLRETISMSLDVLPSSPGLEATSSRVKMGGTSKDARLEAVKVASAQRDAKCHGFHIRPPTKTPEDWRERSTLTMALVRVEAWIYAKVVESIWWQVLTPQMQQPVDTSALEMSQTDGVVEDVSSYGSFGSEVGDDRQKDISINIWKKALSSAYERLCPVRAMGVECGCLSMLNKMVLEECVTRLDVAMFNAILRGSEEAPTDPISDPISDARVLPISTSTLSFGIGAQLKNAVGTLSAWLTNLFSKDADSAAMGHIPEDEEKSWIMFPMLKASGDLLMIPKEMLKDKSMRKEVCPPLSLPFVQRILLSFKPDEFSSEPVTTEVIDAINSEIFSENQIGEEMDDNNIPQRIATAPPVVYSPPQSGMVRHLIGEPTSYGRLGRTNSSVLRKGHTSDDEIDELESPIPWLLENTAGLLAGGHNELIAGGNDCRLTNGDLKDISNEAGTNCRFQLLREVWNMD